MCLELYYMIFLVGSSGPRKEAKGDTEVGRPL